MSGGLILKLHPFEKILINGALVENGDRRTKIRVKTPNVNILRLRDAIHPDEATTPLKAIVYNLQLAIAGDISPCATVAKVIFDLDQLYEAIPAREFRSKITIAKNLVMESEFYRAMRTLKTLLPHEEALLLLSQKTSEQSQTSSAA